MKKILLILVIALPSSLHAGFCNDNYIANQEIIDENFHLQVDACESADCLDEAVTTYSAASLANTVVLLTCCGSLGPLFC